MSIPTISQPKYYLSFIFSILIFLFSYVNRVSAQAPEGISYQAIARGTDGLPLAETDVTVEFRIRSGSVNGSVEYAERQAVETNKFGLFTLSIGKGTILSGSFGGITWATGDKFLQVDINGTLSGTTQMLSVPYALYAAKTKESQTLSVTGNKLSITEGNEVTLPSGTGGGVSNLAELNDVSLSGLQTNQILKWDGTKWVAGTDAGITGDANGDVTGPYTALNVERIQNQPVSNTLPTNGQVLQWDGTVWKANTLSGSGGATTLDGLNDVNAPAPANGQVLQWNAAANAWLPATPSGGTSYTAGTGINIGANNVITNVGDLSSTNEFQTLAFNPTNNTLSISPSGNSITLPVSGGASTLDGLTDVNAATPSIGQILQWNGTAWIPVTPTGGTQYTAGAGVTINASNNIINTGDLDVTNEIQILSIANGNELTLSKNGGTVTLPTSIYTAGTGINLNGNTILNTGDTNAADDITTSTTASGDLSGNFPSPIVSRLQGRTVSTATPQNGQILKYNTSTSQWEPSNEQVGGGSQWVTDATGINYSGGTAKVNNASGSKLVELGTAKALVPAQFQSSYSQNTGSLVTYGENGSMNLFLSHIIDGMSGLGYPNHGGLGIYGFDGYKPTPPFLAYASPIDNSGSMYLSNGNNVITNNMGSYNNVGYLNLINNSGNSVVQMGPFIQSDNQPDGSGAITVFNATNNANVTIGHLNDNINKGFIGVHNTNLGDTFPLAGMYVDPNGSGHVFVDGTTGNFCDIGVNPSTGIGYLSVSGTKNFRMVHPRDTTKEIWYACVEGPEAAAYDRGSATLNKGEYFVAYSEHFSSVVNPNTVTVQLTPLSADTDGLAVVEKTPLGFRVKELRGGQGNFSFDWEVKGVRVGHEAYQAVRPRVRPVHQQLSAPQQPIGKKTPTFQIGH